MKVIPSQADDQPSPAFLRDAAWISKHLTDAQESRFHGKLIICLEGGVAVRIVEERSIKPPHLTGNGS